MNKNILCDQIMEKTANMNSLTKSFNEFRLETEEPKVEEYWKHSLQYKWTFWYLQERINVSWQAKQHRIATVSTAEDFWSLNNSLLPPSELQKGCDYSLFKEGILPMWEDPANITGGRWIFLLSSKDKELLNEAWLDLCLLAIGDVFEYSDDVSGVVVNVRYKYNKISVWTSNIDNIEAIVEIGMMLRDMFGLQSNGLQYQVHRESLLNVKGRFQPLFIL